MKTRKKHSIYVSINTFNNHLHLLSIGEKGTMFLSKILIHSYMTIHYTIEKNILVVICYKDLAQKKY